MPERWSRFARADRWSLVFGEVALYAFDQPQTFSFGADAAVAKALRRGTSLPIHFRPESGLERQPAHVEAPIRITAVALLIARK